MDRSYTRIIGNKNVQAIHMKEIDKWLKRPQRDFKKGLVGLSKHKQAKNSNNKNVVPQNHYKRKRVPHPTSYAEHNEQEYSAEEKHTRIT